MKKSNMILTAAIASALLALPATSLAATNQGCSAAMFTNPAATDNLSNNVITLMGRLRDTSAKVDTETSNLMVADNVNFGQDYFADQYSQIKDQVNQMGRDLCELQSIRSLVPEWQRQSIDRAQARLVNMADLTTQAIDFINQNPTTLWRPEFRSYSTDLNTEAQSVNHLMNKSVDLAQANRAQQKLSRELDVNVNS